MNERHGHIINGNNIRKKLMEKAKKNISDGIKNNRLINLISREVMFLVSKGKTEEEAISEVKTIVNGILN